MKRTYRLLSIMAACLLLAACGTVKDVSYREYHRMETLMDRMDSLIRVKSVVQQDSAWRESVMRQFQSIREKSDTSRSVVLNATGDTIRERIIINNVRESVSESERLEIQKLSSRIETMDSTMNLMRLQLQHSDSLLQASERTVTTTAVTPLSVWQKVQLWLGRAALVILLVIALSWYLSYLKKKMPL